MLLMFTALGCFCCFSQNTLSTRAMCGCFFCCAFIVLQMKNPLWTSAPWYPTRERRKSDSSTWWKLIDKEVYSASSFWAISKLNHTLNVSIDRFSPFSTRECQLVYTLWDEYNFNDHRYSRAQRRTKILQHPLSFFFSFSFRRVGNGILN